MKTKIVATLGPTSKSEQVIWGMIEAGADVFRINLSHGDREQWDSLVEVIRKVSSEMGEEVAILADLQGPKIRTGETPLGGIKLNTGDIVTLTTRQVSMEPGLISINYKDFAKDVKAGERVLIDDGKLTLLIRSSDMKSEVQAEVLNGGVLTSRKGVNLPNTVLSLPALTSRDRENLEWIMKSDIDWVALSFVRSSGDIRALRDAMKMYPRGFYPGIIAKIEKPEAVADIDPIIRAADAIMIARGDLGVEIPFEQVPFIQKSIIQKCIKHGRPVIVATQMLEGMLTSMQPTRAEINDVANSVIDGADAL
ncbi:MAG TPA: pyruvate kinase, partial [Bacteroidales bacterium]|nr:pyruvate kinase [Bacteroidales bacterium]